MLLIVQADARHLPLADQSVQMCVTSPPYWGLRDYGTGTWSGGDAACDHQQGRKGAGRADGVVDERGQRNRDGVSALTRAICQCGAVRSDPQLGLESTPEAYVAAIVAAMREVRRVLKDDGTLWLNLGDSYAGSWGAQGRNGQMVSRSIISQRQIDEHPQFATRTGARGIGSDGLKPKDLVGIPWRVAFALQADGWYLRSDIIWSKPNPMPESVRDRPTKAHEYLFLLTKAERYWYDAGAIAEPVIKGAAGSTFTEGKTGTNGQGRVSLNDRYEAESRNRRSVWTVATQPYPGAHFATFPPKLIEPCILAGSRPGDVVLDPFAGSGTTGMVALTHGRRAVLCDLSTSYLREQAVKRTQTTIGLGL